LADVELAKLAMQQRLADEATEEEMRSANEAI
jgi:hypothetical protein